MYAFFLIVQLAGLLHFGFSKRRFDFLSAAFFASCIYFMPVHFGYVLYPDYHSFTEVPILDETILVLALVLLMLTLAAVFTDVFHRETAAPEPEPANSSTPTPHSPLALRVLLIFTVFGLIMSILPSSKAIIGSSKTDVLESLDRWSVLWTTAALIGFTLAVQLRRYLDVLLFSAALLFDLYLGFRVSMAIALLSVISLALWKKGPQRLFLRSWKLCGLVMAFASCMLVYKAVLWSIRANDLEMMVTLITTPETYELSITRAEPFCTQAILNAVVEYDYHAHPRCITDAIGILIPFATVVGAEPKSFNHYFQEALFPGLSFGMANNIWAQMISVGGWLLLLCFIALFTLLQYGLSRLLRNPNPILRCLVALSGVLWGFYVHRNDLIYQLTMQRRILVVAAGLVALTAAAAVLRERRGRILPGRTDAAVASESPPPSTTV